MNRIEKLRDILWRCTNVDAQACVQHDEVCIHLGCCKTWIQQIWIFPKILLPHYSIVITINSLILCIKINFNEYRMQPQLSRNIFETTISGKCPFLSRPTCRTLPQKFQSFWCTYITCIQNPTLYLLLVISIQLCFVSKYRFLIVSW